jgi:hypothetical protein
MPHRDTWRITVAVAISVIVAVSGVALSNPELTDLLPGYGAFAAALLRETARLPVVQTRIFLGTPAAFWPGVIAAAFLGVALLRDRLRLGRQGRSIELLAMAVICGYALWGVRFGRLDWTSTGDFQKDWIYMTAAKQAVTGFQLPYYLRFQLQGTERFLSNLETNWGPHVVLLRSMAVETFFPIHVGLCALAGSFGLIALRRELELTLFPWCVFVLIFVLNGHITAHLEGGHTQWAGYFLMPIVFLSTVRTANGDVSRSNGAMLSATLAALIVIGSWHIFVWCLLFAGMVSIGSMARMRFIFGVSCVVAGLAAFRLLPALATFGSGANDFLGGFQDPSLLITALVGDPRDAGPKLGFVEFDMFIGWSGLFLLALGLMPGLPRRSAIDALWLPSVAMIVLAMSDIYRQTLFHLPGFVSERVSTRLAIVGVLGLVLRGVERISRWDDAEERRSMVGVGARVVFGAFLAVQLLLRAETRRPPPGAAVMWRSPDVVKQIPVETAYFWSVWLGLAVSLIAAVLFVWYVRTDSRSRKVTQ